MTISTGTTRLSSRFSPRGIRTPGEDPALPAADGTHVDVDEVGIAIVTNSAAAQAERGVPQRRSRNARQTDIDGFRQHVQTVESDARMRAAGSQKFVGLRRAVSTDHLDLAADIMQRCGEIVEQVE